MCRQLPAQDCRHASIPSAATTATSIYAGSRALNEGRVIILPPNIPIQEGDPDAAVNYHFDSGRIALRVEIRDVEAGDEDGDGIDAVIFRIFDNLERGQGNVVYARSDTLPPYCMLPDIDQCQKDDKDLCCTSLFFGLDKQWPNDEDVVDGDYRLEIEILPETGSAGHMAMAIQH